MDIVVIVVDGKPVLLKIHTGGSCSILTSWSDACNSVKAERDDGHEAKAFLFLDIALEIVRPFYEAADIHNLGSAAYMVF